MKSPQVWGLNEEQHKTWFLPAWNIEEDSTSLHISAQVTRWKLTHAELQEIREERKKLTFVVEVDVSAVADDVQFWKKR